VPRKNADFRFPRFILNILKNTSCESETEGFEDWEYVLLGAEIRKFGELEL
jgi:hypothetical protein